MEVMANVATHPSPQKSWVGTPLDPAPDRMESGFSSGWRKVMGCELYPLGVLSGFVLSNQIFLIEAVPLGASFY